MSFQMKNSYETGEEFYQDLKKHLIEDGVIPKNSKWEHYEPQRDYFKVALDYFYKSNIAYNAYYTSSLTIWDHIRCLIYSYFGVKLLQQMKLEWKEEANNKAIEIMRLLEKGDKAACIDCEYFNDEEYYADNTVTACAVSFGSCTKRQRNITSTSPHTEVPSWCPLKGDEDDQSH